MDDIVYFEVNNWCAGENYPTEEPFTTWLSNDCKQQLMNDEWAKENKICVVFMVVDMSFNYAVTAPLSWVKEHCPIILEEPWKSKFCYKPEDDEDDVCGHFSYFLPYEEENFGVTQRDW